MAAAALAVAVCHSPMAAPDPHGAPAPVTLPALTFLLTDRLLVLAPHPDDETIACGGVLQQARALGLPVRVVFLTYGDNNEWSFAIYRKHAVLAPSAVRGMGEIRHDEALAATSVLGLPGSASTFLGYPDFGTLRIWMNHWGERPPLEGMLTRAIAVPYTNAFRFAAPYKGESILADLESILREFRPTRVFVSHPADFNPDHRALYLFTRVALWDLEPRLKPTLHPYLVHFPRWPTPRKDDPTLPLVPPPVLTEASDWSTLALSEAQRSVKAEALRRHRTQYAYSARYLGLFLRANECFGDFPPVRLSTNTPVTGDRNRQIVSAEPDEEPGTLTDEERALFVGVEWRQLDADAQNLSLSIRLSRPLGEAVGVAIGVCGYRPDVPFERMPKLHIDIGTLATRVDDNGRTLAHDGNVKVTKRLHEIDVKVPWATLQAPSRLMISARTYLGDIPLDWAAWRVVEIAP